MVTFSLGVLWKRMGKALWAGVGHRGRYQSIRDVLAYVSSQDGWPKKNTSCIAQDMARCLRGAGNPAAVGNCSNPYILLLPITTSPDPLQPASKLRSTRCVHSPNRLLVKQHPSTHTGLGQVCHCICSFRLRCSIFYFIFFKLFCLSFSTFFLC